VKPIKYLSGGWSAGVHSSVRYASGFLYICWKIISCATTSKQRWCLIKHC